MIKNRFYLMYEGVYYGIITLVGQEVMTSTKYQSEASIYFGEELPEVIHKLKKRGIQVKTKLIDFPIKTLRGSRESHRV